MRNFWIVLGREYMTRVKKKSFIILTILMPFMMVALVCVPMILGMIKDDDAQRQVVVLDNTERYLPLFLEAQKTDSTKLAGYQFVAGAGDVQMYNNEEMDIAAVVNITDTLTKNPSAVRIYSRGEVQRDLQVYVEDILNEQIRKDKLASYGIPQLDVIVDDLRENLSIQTIKWGKDGEETFSFGEIAMILGLISALLIYMFVMLYGAMVMQSVMEEKTNRIVEVIVGSVKPFHLMMGKIIGVLCVGLTQILIWGTMIMSLVIIGGMVFGASSVDADTVKDTMTAVAEAQQQGGAMATAQAMPQLPESSPAAELLTAFNNLPLAEIAIFFVLFFLGGYMLYASFYAAIGAAINSQEDSSQFMMPMMIVMIFSIYAAMGSMENTDGPLAFWASLFPLTSPIVMMVRLPFGVPLWQELLSIALLYATAVLFVWFSARIYRVGILMYGKKPTMKELIKWLKY